MIGLALVVFVTIFAAGLKTSVAKTIDESFRGEIVLQNSDGFSPIPREAVRRAGEVDGVDTVSSITYATGALPNGGQNVRWRRSTRARSARSWRSRSRAATRPC